MNTPSLTRHDRITGGLIGLLVGDALGVPYEFTPSQTCPIDRIEMTLLGGAAVDTL